MAAPTIWSASTVEAALDAGTMFASWFVSSVADMTIAVPPFVSMEAVEGPLPGIRYRAGVAVTRIITIVDVAVEACVSVIPGTSPDEETASEPVP